MTIVKKYNEKGNPNAINDEAQLDALKVELLTIPVPEETKSEETKQ